MSNRRGFLSVKTTCFLSNERSIIETTRSYNSISSQCVRHVISVWRVQTDRKRVNITENWSNFFFFFLKKTSNPIYQKKVENRFPLKFCYPAKRVPSRRVRQLATPHSSLELTGKTRTGIRTMLLHAVAVVRRHPAWDARITGNVNCGFRATGAA